jgi:hypothetical protein
MPPDSLPPAPADGQPIGVQTLPADVRAKIAQIGEEITRLQQEEQSLKEEGRSLSEQAKNLAEILRKQAMQKDQQAAEIRVQIAKLSGAQAQTIKTAMPRIGEKIEGKGIYLGVWHPKYTIDKSLGKAFAVYAAPEDLTNEHGEKLVATFQDHAKRVAALKGWHGHDGFDGDYDWKIKRGLADGSVVGKWFIPARELLCGFDVYGIKQVQDDNMFVHKDKLGKITTLLSSAGCDYVREDYYVSSTVGRDGSNGLHCSRLSDGFGACFPKDRYPMSCRPVLVEELVY